MIKVAWDNDAFLGVSSSPSLAFHNSHRTPNWRLPILQVLSPTWKKYAGDLSVQVTLQN